MGTTRIMFWIVTPPFFKKQLIYTLPRRKLIKIIVRDQIDLRTVYDTFYSLQYSKFDLSEKNHSLIDLGGHIGSSVLYLNEIYNLSKIVVVEPNPHNYLLLATNLKMNGITAELYDGAISDVIKEAKFSVGEQSDSGAIALNDPYKINKQVKPEFYTEIDINVITLLRLKQMFAIKGNIILKVDIEGAEYELFQDEKMLDDVSIAYIETHDFHLNRPITYKLFGVENIENYLIKLNGENLELKKSVK
jgi:FkbM family methyltransferase